MDIYMPIIDGIRATEIITKRDSNAKVLLFSISDSKIELYKAYKAGAKGLIHKSASVKIIADAIKKVNQGGYYYMNGVSDSEIINIVNKFDEICCDDSEKGPEFTAREEEILVLIGEKYTSKEIADKLNVSINTIAFHRKNIKAKLNATSYAEVVNYALKKVRNKL